MNRAEYRRQKRQEEKGEARRLRKGVYAFKEHIKTYGTNHKDIYRPVDETAKALLDMLELDMAQSGATI